MVFRLMPVAGSLACGVLRPQPRWSNSTARYRSGSNPRRMFGPQPVPGPPCTNRAGLPAGLPQVSQYMAVPSPASSRPDAYGSIGGYHSAMR